MMAAIVSFFLVGTGLSVFLFGLLKSEGGTRIQRRWSFSATDLGGFSYTRLALVSSLGLFLELLMIRWVSSEVRIFAYLKNVVLIACFLGFGLGCYLCRRKVNLLVMVMPLLTLALLIKLPWSGLRESLMRLPVYIGAVSDVDIWGLPSIPLSALLLVKFLAAVLFVVPVFALIALTFVPIGQLVGWYLESAQGISGYSCNVLASLAGILLYTLICFLNEPPPIWFALAGAMGLILFWKSPLLRWTVAIIFAGCVGLVSLGPGSDTVVYWSPYQKLTLTPVRENGEIVRYSLNTNDTWYQQILNLSAPFVATHRSMFENAPIEWNAYNLPYHFYPRPPSVLILGAGMGNDVAAALRNNATRVVAVEIDPLILELGKELHFEHPYASPRVIEVVDDARSYLQNSTEQFDLIVFSLLDSHTTSSHYSNIRIDNYVYTVEAMASAKRLLKPNGIFIIKFEAQRPWISGRLHDLLERVFGRPPMMLEVSGQYTTRGKFFITGSEHTVQQALNNRALADFVKQNSGVAIEKATLTTDDWPYFYQHEPGVPASILTIAVVLVFLCVASMAQTGTTVRELQWHFFFLGAGFLLLEAQIISKMALLFGTTWVVNSIVISGLLLLMIAANGIVQKRPQFPMHAAYAGILVSILVSYVTPLEVFFVQSVWLKALGVSLILCAPVFFASIVFIRSFAAHGFQGEALGSNLMGALVGGLLESLSLWMGIKSLLLLAALLYAASYLALGQSLAGAEANESGPTASAPLKPA